MPQLRSYRSIAVILYMIFNWFKLQNTSWKLAIIRKPVSDPSWQSCNSNDLHVLVTRQQTWLDYTYQQNNLSLSFYLFQIQLRWSTKQEYVSHCGNQHEPWSIHQQIQMLLLSMTTISWELPNQLCNFTNRGCQQPLVFKYQEWEAINPVK